VDGRDDESEFKREDESKLLAGSLVRDTESLEISTVDVINEIDWLSDSPAIVCGKSSLGRMVLDG